MSSDKEGPATICGRRECLDWMLIVSQRHLEAVLGEYCAHCNDERPHRSCGLRPNGDASARI